jgi:hypothetical protein
MVTTSTGAVPVSVTLLDEVTNELALSAKVVVFTPTAVSGGPAFVRVAREQERVSARYVAAAREGNAR